MTRAHCGPMAAWLLGEKMALGGGETVVVGTGTAGGAAMAVVAIGGEYFAFAPAEAEAVADSAERTAGQVLGQSPDAAGSLADLAMGLRDAARRVRETAAQ